MSLTTIRKAVADAVLAGVPGLKTCEPHGGRFDASELRRLAVGGPAVFVAVLGVQDLVFEHGEAKGEVQFAAFAVAGDKAGLPRDKAVMAMADALALLVPDNRWGLDESESVPMRVRAENLFSVTVDKAGVALWAVSWRQRMALGQGLDDSTLETLDLFATCDIDYAIGQDGTPVAEDTVSLPQED